MFRRVTATAADPSPAATALSVVIPTTTTNSLADPRAQRDTLPNPKTPNATNSTVRKLVNQNRNGPTRSTSTCQLGKENSTLARRPAES
ncbi:hypothetical protein FXN61_24085 [Lentzea sp. PSKA42]|uniref:Uncharacterized protein n=1 Tax=Lentzea indica TaxID=2604800 RepID=A0ABX1FLT8_9PSEU|nr:hypothetical protein [Lentzea indica]NKE59720.1 hypothetical protein [Lentzea indica]